MLQLPNPFKRTLPFRIFRKGQAWFIARVLPFLLERAKRLLDKPTAILQLLKQAAQRIRLYDNSKEMAQDLKERLILLLRLIKAYVTGQYKEFSEKNLLLSLAALLYFISPIDFMADFLPVIGIMDDLALLTWVVGNFKQELDAFQDWEDRDKIKIQIESKVPEE